MTRSIPPSFSPIITALELDAPEIITMAELTELVRSNGIGTSPKVVADRLRKLGWLLPTGTVGAWEFAPGGRAGPIGGGDPYIELKAALGVRPTLDAAVCLTSALAAHGLVERRPEVLEVAVPTGSSIPSGLRRRARVVIFRANVAPKLLSGVPIHRPVTVLVHLAARPSDVRGWGAIADVLGELVEGTDADDLDAELTDRPRSVRVRLAYLIQGVAPDLADRLVPTVDGGSSAAKVWFGSRTKIKRHSARFSVADSLLPFDPGDLRTAL